MPPPKLLPSLQTAPKSPGKFKPDQNAKDRPDLFSVPMDVIYGLLGMDANSTGRMQNGKPAQLSSPNAIGQTLSAGLPIAGASRLLYSRLEKAAKALPEFAHPNRIFSLLKSNASGEEMGLRGIEKFLQSRGDARVSRTEVLDHLAGNPLPDVTKSVLTPQGKRNYSGADVNKAQYHHPSLTTPLEAPRQDYRENLYHINQPGEVYGAPHFDNTDIDSIVGPIEGNQNLLMHSRTTERDLPNRGRTLLGEEDQSDWHQQGRTEGYKTPEGEAARGVKNDKLEVLADKISQIEDEYLARNGEHIMYANPAQSSDPLVQQRDQIRREMIRLQAEFIAAYPRGVSALPDAPYKQEWPNILWKDQLGQAVTDPEIKGYAWAQGREQNRRSGRLPEQWEGVDVEPWETDPEKPMQDFYDVRKKNAIDKFVRQHGGRVEEIEVPGLANPNVSIRIDPATGNVWRNLENTGFNPEHIASAWPPFEYTRTNTSQVAPRGQDLTPASREQIQQLHNIMGSQQAEPMKLWYVSLPDHVKESIKRGGIPFLMALWATHQAGQDSNMAIPTPPGAEQ